jgi:hypothetical protein
MLLEDKNAAIYGVGHGSVDEQHSAARTVVLHLLPGALIMAFYAGVAPVVRSLGFPSLMAIFLAIAFVLIPFEFGYLIYQARKNATTLGSVVLYRRRVRRGQFVALVLGLLTWSGICVGLLPMVYAAWWKRSIYVSMAVHVLGNAIPMVFLLAGLLGTSRT